jgi:hypothetical protein
MARQTKTERQRAEDALGVAQRKVDRLIEESKKLGGQLAKVDRDLDDAKKLLAYRRQHPALPSTTTTGSTATTQKETTTP